MNPFFYLLDKLSKRVTRADILRDAKRQFRLYKTFPRDICRRITDQAHFYEMVHDPGNVAAIGEIRQKIVRLAWQELPDPAPINLVRTTCLSGR